jgi:hypothetical protein
LFFLVPMLSSEREISYGNGDKPSISEFHPARRILLGPRPNRVTIGSCPRNPGVLFLDVVTPKPASFHGPGLFTVFFRRFPARRTFLILDGRKILCF